MRNIIRHLLLDLLSLSYFFKKYKNKGFVQFVYFHDILPTELARFEKLILEFKSNFELVSHSKACELLNNNSLEKNYLAISFDDGFKNNLEVGRILSKHQISACFFVCPGYIETLTGQERKQVLRSIFNEQQDKEFMAWKDLNELKALGHEIGTHTMTHINLSACSLGQIEEELTSSIKKLEEQGFNVVHFAFPYGRKIDYNFKADQLIRSFEFESISNAERGIHINKPNPFIFRDHVLISWPFRHIHYFLKRNQYASTYQNIQWLKEK